MTSSPDNPTDLCLDDFLYDLPEDLIAQEPLARRDDSRLLVRSRDGTLRDGMVKNLASELPAGALVIVNNSRVIASRLLGRTPTGGRAELMLLEPATDGDGANEWYAIGKPMKKFKQGTVLEFGAGCEATIVSEPQKGPEVLPVRVRFNISAGELERWLDLHAYIPLPPYIARPDAKPAPESSDTARYQTIYAEPKGSVAAPTAGLHFTPDVVASLNAKGISLQSVTLHVGAGTFMPVKVQNLDEHTMHEERFLMPRATFDAIAQARREGRPIVAVGTTTLRCMESFVRLTGEGELEGHVDRWHRTNLFIRPRSRTDRHRPWAIDALMTNFHQPGSTLFMLISALIGLDEAKAAYAHAVEKRYRFLSYGDSCLFWL